MVAYIGENFMSGKAKKFTRGVGFTFTPSRVNEDHDSDYIEELNQILAESGLSQNKFIEVMLKEAIEYKKLKSNGNGIVQNVIINERNTNDTTVDRPENLQINAEQRIVTQNQTDVSIESSSHIPQKETSVLTENKTEIATEPVTNPTETTQNDEQDAIRQRLANRFKKTRLNST